jgi:hypothetical protein
MPGKESEEKIICATCGGVKLGNGVPRCICKCIVLNLDGVKHLLTIEEAADLLAEKLKSHPRTILDIDSEP